MSAETILDPFAFMRGLVLEDGRMWGALARPWQLDDAEAVISRDGPRRHYQLRGRGMSKTGDAAGVALSLLLTEAPARSRSHAFAVDADQAGLLMDAIAGYVVRTGLQGAVELGARSVSVRRTGASLVVESSDGASAFGLKPWLTVVDEFAMWPSTTRHRMLWSAIASAVPKVHDGRLLVITTAGSPSGIGARVWDEAQRSPHWRTSKRAGPSPWWSRDDIAELRGSLTAAEWRRLIDVEFAEGDDALTTPEDVEAVIRAGASVLEPRRGIEYVAGLDVGTRRDLTALAIGHAERREHGRVVVIDRVMSWRPPGRGGKVDLAEVEASVLRVCRAYSARLRFDRMQAEQLTSNIVRAGMRAEEYVFSSSGANRLARALYGALRDRALELPDDEELRREFVSARMVETGPGVVKIQNPRGTHDDLVVAVGMVVADIVERGDVGFASITVPRSAQPVDGGRSLAARVASGDRREIARTAALHKLGRGATWADFEARFGRRR